MAKSQLRQYVFTPGAATIGTIRIPGRINLEQVLVITNTTVNKILYNFADSTYSGTTAVFTAGNDATNFPTIVQREDGYTTITLAVTTVGQSSGDRLSILIEVPETTFRPYRFGTDAIERMRISQGQSMIDADFEYGLQPTKWGGYGIIRGYPAIYDYPGVDLTLSTVTTDGTSPNSIITVTTIQAHGLSVGNAINITGSDPGITGSSRADGNFFVLAVNSSVQFTYYAWGIVGISNGQSLYTDAQVLKRGNVYTGASLNTASAASNGANPSVITITFNSNHGLVPGCPIYVTMGGGTNASFASGPFFVETVPSLTTITYTARSPGIVVSPTSPTLYAVNENRIIHRPFDGGVLISAGVPSHAASVVRVSKKYFRYQSGKGLLWSTGTLLRPNYDILSLISSGTAPGSTITLTTDAVAHGLQIGALITVSGAVTSGYNGTYRVNGITDDYTFTFLSIATLGSTTATLDITAKLTLTKWHGSTIRAGCFDDQNGMFWEFDGSTLYVARRNATQQLSGTITANPNSNQITGSNTRFTQQVIAGNKIVIRGMTHWVTQVASDTTMYVNPDYRGTLGVNGVKASLVQETRIPQSQFNIDKLDGTGPSGFTIDTGKMHMLGIQYTWYGAGFIDFMVRGSDGNWVFAHRIKNNNVNFEAHMRSGNLPVRYSIENEQPSVSSLASAIDNSQNTITLVDNTYYATTGTVYIDNELISYTGKNGTTQLTGCGRAATLTQYTGGTTRSFTAGVAASHTQGTGVVQVSCYASPTLSHWGSALLCDGLFDSDRGYIFNYQRVNINISASTQTVFLVRLAPSVSNSAIGDLGIKDLLNRSQLLLNACNVSIANPSSNPPSIIIEGVLNAKNFGSATWSSLNLENQGGQPSLAQVAQSVTWSSGSYAIPGEQVFAFTAYPNADASLDLSGLKELTNSPFGGVGAYPNGPDVLAINVRVSGGGGGTATGAVLLRWGEAQA
jgi:hypothetical protein